MSAPPPMGMTDHIKAHLRIAGESAIDTLRHLYFSLEVPVAWIFGERVGRDGDIIRFRGCLYLANKRRRREDKG